MTPRRRRRYNDVPKAGPVRHLRIVGPEDAPRLELVKVTPAAQATREARRVVPSDVVRVEQWRDEKRRRPV